MIGQRRRSAFTLIETLAVVALLAMAMVVGAVQLSGASRRARTDAALHTLTRADLSARSIAMAGRPTKLVLGGQGAVVEVLRAGQSEPVLSHPLPTGVEARLERARGASLAGLTFDTAGRCEDHERVVTVLRVEVARVRVSGITGWAEPVLEGTP